MTNLNIHIQEDSNGYRVDFYDGLRVVLNCHVEDYVEALTDVASRIISYRNQALKEKTECLELDEK